MKKPKHSFHEPKETYIKEERIDFSGLYGCSLKEINEAWDCTLKQHPNMGYTITNLSVVISCLKDLRIEVFQKKH